MKPEDAARFDRELRQAEAARREGNEGKARVCARRAAGIIAGVVLQRHGLPADASAYSNLRDLSRLHGLPEDAQRIAAHFLERVDTDFQLPAEIDLIEHARWLLRWLQAG